MAQRPEPPDEAEQARLAERRGLMSAECARPGKVSF